MSRLTERAEKIKKIENDLRKYVPEYKDLLRLAAGLMCDCEELEEEAKKWQNEWEANQLLRRCADVPAILKSRGESYNPDGLAQLMLGIDCLATKTHIALAKAHAAGSALKAANAKHSRPGGSRDLADRMRKIWASGKYASLDICAEQECGALDMSFSAARKALRNTPDPS
jgi:hypothetical protein